MRWSLKGECGSIVRLHASLFLLFWLRERCFCEGKTRLARTGQRNVTRSLRSAGGFWRNLFLLVSLDPRYRRVFVLTVSVKRHIDPIKSLVRSVITSWWKTFPCRHDWLSGLCLFCSPTTPSSTRSGRHSETGPPWKAGPAGRLSWVTFFCTLPFFLPKTQETTHSWGLLGWGAGLTSDITT